MEMGSMSMSMSTSTQTQLLSNKPPLFRPPPKFAKFPRHRVNAFPFPLTDTSSFKLLLHQRHSTTTPILLNPPLSRHHVPAPANALSSSDTCVIYHYNPDQPHATTQQERVGVLLLNLGGPETLDDVQPFLYNLFADPDIIRLPRLFKFLQKPLAQLISVLRAPKSKQAYASIGGGSPLLRITNEQAEALKEALEEKKLHAKIYVGMRYWHPFTEEAIDQIKKDHISKLVVLPLYPQFSISTSGSSISVLNNIFREDGYFEGLPVSIIESWYQRDGYITSMADLIQKELLSFSNADEVMIFFSAHGVPVSYVEESGDPYKDQMDDCISLIMRELKSRGVRNSHVLAYQSRVGPVQWLKPYTDELIVELGQKGVKSLLAVPISFVSEHIETLEEIDMEYRELALESGIENWGRVPALNCNSSFISDLANLVIEALPTASAVARARNINSADDGETHITQYVFKMLFGSVMAFFLLFIPRLISSLKKPLF